MSISVVILRRIILLVLVRCHELRTIWLEIISLFLGRNTLLFLSLLFEQILLHLLRLRLHSCWTLTGINCRLALRVLCSHLLLWLLRLHQRVWMLAFDEDQDALALLRNEAGYNFLRNIFGRVVEQFFKLQAWKAMDYFIFALDCNWVLCVKLVEPTFLLKHVFDESASTISHLAQSVSKSSIHLILPSVGLLSVYSLISHVPNIVWDEFFHSLSLSLIYSFLLQARKCLW